MFQTPAPTLRVALRADTRAAHDRLDSRLASHDVATRTGFTVFLDTHAAAFASLSHSLGAAGRPHALLTALLGATRRDLASLGQPDPARLPAPLPALPHAPAAQAVDYVLHGSRLGTAVLRRIWAASADPEVLRADAYFGPAPDTRAWQVLSRSLSAESAGTESARRVIADARMLFDLFRAGLDHAEARAGSPAHG